MLQGSKRGGTLASTHDVRVAFVSTGAIAAVTFLFAVGGINAFAILADTCIGTHVLPCYLARPRPYLPVQGYWNCILVCIIKHCRFDIAGVETESSLFHYYYVAARTVLPYVCGVIVFVEIATIIRNVFRDIGLAAAGTRAYAILEGDVGACCRATYYILHVNKCIYEISYTKPG
jgi:hypothetical protein